MFSLPKHTRQMCPQQLTFKVLIRFILVFFRRFDVLGGDAVELRFIFPFHLFAKLVVSYNGAFDSIYTLLVVCINYPQK